MPQPFKNSANLSAPHSPLSEGCPQDGFESKQIFINGVIIGSRQITKLPYNSKLKEKSKLLRQAGNLPEVLFWVEVTKRNFHKIDFDRQKIIGNYIVDFYIKFLGLIIEIDGSSHDDKELYDKIREQYFISLGLAIYRIPVDDVMKNIDFVKMGLEEYIIEHYAISSGG